jgi:hypothetical protein
MPTGALVPRAWFRYLLRCHHPEAVQVRVLIGFFILKHKAV